jgi:hypothetical protein
LNSWYLGWVIIVNARSMLASTMLHANRDRSRRCLARMPAKPDFIWPRSYVYHRMKYWPTAIGVLIKGSRMNILLECLLIIPDVPVAGATSPHHDDALTLHFMWHFQSDANLVPGIEIYWFDSPRRHSFDYRSHHVRIEARAWKSPKPLHGKEKLSVLIQ